MDRREMLRIIRDVLTRLETEPQAGCLWWDTPSGCTSDAPSTLRSTPSAARFSGSSSLSFSSAHMRAKFARSSVIKWLAAGVCTMETTDFCTLFC